MDKRREEIQRRMETLQECETDLVKYAMSRFYKAMDKVDRKYGYLFVDEEGQERYREGRRIDYIEADL